MTKVKRCTFEIVPYHTRADIAGVPGPSPEEATAEHKANARIHFAKMITIAKGLNAGDPVWIGYQLDRTTLLGYKITHIVGSGSLQKAEPKK